MQQLLMERDAAKREQEEAKREADEAKAATDERKKAEEKAVLERIAVSCVLCFPALPYEFVVPLLFFLGDTDRDISVLPSVCLHICFARVV